MLVILNSTCYCKAGSIPLISHELPLLPNKLITKTNYGKTYSNGSFKTVNDL